MTFPIFSSHRQLALLAALLVLPLTSCDKVWEVGQKLKAPEEVVVPEPEPVVAEPIDVPPPPMVEKKPEVNPDAQVSILGYHDFSDRSSTNDMVMEVNHLREQMQALKDNGVPVIPMSDYLAWKRGDRKIPDPSVVITMDDGWEAVYTHAFPVLKEFGFPFSIYLYKNYVNVGGRSLSWAQIREMMADGCEVGSHSVSHYWLTRPRGSTEEEKAAWLEVELKGSMEFLQENLGDEVLPVFAYPYGAHNEQVRDMAVELGYELAVTVAPKKANHKSPDFEVGRYIVHGTNDTNFNYAMSFGGGASLTSGQSLLAQTQNEEGAEEEPLVTTWPASGELITERLPYIQVNVSKLTGIDPGSIRMQVGGFGEVAPYYDPQQGLIGFQIPQRLRSESCKVNVRLRRQGEARDDFISWSFKVDRKALYLQALKDAPEEDGSAMSTASESNEQLADSMPASN